MFYIEKNDKLSWFEKMFNLVILNDDTIYLPIYEKIKLKDIEKIAKKINKIVLKNSISKKLVLSKEIFKVKELVNYLNMYEFEIPDGKWLFKVLMPEIVEYVINKKELDKEKSYITFLINDFCDSEYENIKDIAHEYKNINIVTNHVEKFKRLQEELSDEGIIIIVSNNKKKSLAKSDIIINIDFPNELINNYIIKDDAIIVNIRGNIKINSKRFNGININDYEIDYRGDRKTYKEINGKYELKILYEANHYKKQRITDIRKCIRNDKVIIKKLKK